MTYFNTPHLLATAAAFATIGFAPALFAQQECGDQTCDDGFTCASFETLCPEIDCAEGEDCPTCEQDEVFYCERAQCESDDECGDYMICATMTEYDCSNLKEVDCAPDEPCEEPDGECEAVDIERCAPPWELPCEADADCGDGFTCEPYQCGCDGAASGGSRGEADVPPEEASAGSEDPATSELIIAGDCECDPPEGGWCRIIEQECEADSDCPDMWTCQENPNGTCWADSEGNTGCEPADPPYLCMPPGMTVGILTAEAADAAATSGLAPETEQAAVGGSSVEGGDDSNAEDLPVVDLEDVDESAQSGVAGDNDGEEQAPDVAELGSEGDLEDEGSSSSSSSGGGCTVAATPGAGSADLMAMLAALGAALTMRRRREQRS